MISHLNPNSNNNNNNKESKNKIEKKIKFNICNSDNKVCNVISQSGHICHSHRPHNHMI